MILERERRGFRERKRNACNIWKDLLKREGEGITNGGFFHPKTATCRYVVGWGCESTIL